MMGNCQLKQPAGVSSGEKACRCMEIQVCIRTERDSEREKNQEGAEGCCRLTLSRHETQLFRSATPHETPRASADAHGERTLLHKSDTGGDATHRLSVRREK